MRYSVPIFLCAAIFLAAPAAAEERNALAPYRFEPSDLPLTAVERARALAYRSQLQTQLKSLDQDEAAGDLQGRDRRLLLDIRKELGRMDGIARQPQPLGTTLPAGRPLPSLSNGSLR